MLLGSPQLVDIHPFTTTMCHAVRCFIGGTLYSAGGHGGGHEVPGVKVGVSSMPALNPSPPSHLPGLYNGLIFFVLVLVLSHTWGALGLLLAIYA